MAIELWTDFALRSLFGKPVSFPSLPFASHLLISLARGLTALHRTLLQTF